MDHDRSSDSLRSLLNSPRSIKTSTGFLSIATTVLSIALLRWLNGRIFNRSKHEALDAISTDPGILAKHSTIGPVTTRRFTYSSIRLAYCPHPKIAKLPQDIPLLVFVHGLGGSAAQFVPLVTSLSNAASCLLIDLPGCGRSELSPRNGEAYTLPAFAELVAAAIDRFRQPGQKVVLVGHSLGCSINALLASDSSPCKDLLCTNDIVSGMVAICPRVDVITDKQKQSLRRLRYMPSFVFDAFRLWDRRGGLQSGSITRFVGKDADTETRKLQQKYNHQSRTPTLLKFLLGFAHQGSVWPGEEIWSGIEVPIFLVAAEADTAVSPKAIDEVVEWLKESHASRATSRSISKHQSTADAPPAATGEAEAGVQQLVAGEKPGLMPLNDASMSKVTVEHETTHHAHAIKTTLFPAPAAHGVMYSTATARPLASLIQNFLASHIDSRLSPAWQLNHMSTAGKWEVKNLKKWQKVEPISGVIAGRFRAMKTMREVDKEHTPKVFVINHGFHDGEGHIRKDSVAVIIDISHETPVYDPEGLKIGGIEYHKYPTISKLPPSRDEVAGYIALINKIREENADVKSGANIATHCHYGFNRTGFFLISYLIEQLGWPVKAAIEEFQNKRPPGIKHDYFIDELFLRYGVSIERRGTIIG